jgi:hypothetical protein
MAKAKISDKLIGKERYGEKKEEFEEACEVLSALRGVAC